MKLWLFCLVMATLACAVHAELSPDPEAQAQALAKYPALNQKGTPFNDRFVGLVQEARATKAQILNDPRWPLLIAETVAKELGTKPVQAALTDPGRGLQKFVKMSVAEVAASPFSLEGVMVELTGIDRIKVQEVERGVYEVDIRGASGSSYLRGKLSAEQAALAERSRTLFISVSDPDEYRTLIHIHGNTSRHAGLSTVPTVGWAQVR